MEPSVGVGVPPLEPDPPVPPAGTKAEKYSVQSCSGSTTMLEELTEKQLTVALSVLTFWMYFN